MTLACLMLGDQIMLSPLSLAAFSIYMVSQAIPNEVGYKFLPMFSVCPVATHYIIRDRLNHSSNDARTLDMGIYGWSAIRINDSFKKFERFPHAEQRFMFESVDIITRSKNSSNKMDELYRRYNSIARNDDSTNSGFKFRQSDGSYSDEVRYTDGRILSRDEFDLLVNALSGLELVHIIDTVLYIERVSDRITTWYSIEDNMRSLTSIDGSKASINQWRRWGNVYVNN